MPSERSEVLSFLLHTQKLLFFYTVRNILQLFPFKEQQVLEDQKCVQLYFNILFAFLPYPSSPVSYFFQPSHFVEEPSKYSIQDTVSTPVISAINNNSTTEQSISKVCPAAQSQQIKDLNAETVSTKMSYRNQSEGPCCEVQHMHMGFWD